MLNNFNLFSYFNVIYELYIHIIHKCRYILTLCIISVMFLVNSRHLSELQ